MFTQTPPSKPQRILQRLDFAESRAPQLVRELAELVLDSGRMKRLWRETAALRRLFIDEYKGLQPLVQMSYWRHAVRDVESFSVSTKRFDSLRRLYLDCFETGCRLLVIGKAVEAIIHNNTTHIALANRSVTLDEFDKMPNGVKLRDHFSRMVVWDLFGHAFDVGLRNGVGHNAAHYEPETDEVCLATLGQGGVEYQRIPYTTFCKGVLDIIGAAELAAIYHHWLHMYVNGKLE